MAECAQNSCHHWGHNLWQEFKGKRKFPLKGHKSNRLRTSSYFPINASLMKLFLLFYCTVFTLIKSFCHTCIIFVVQIPNKTSDWPPLKNTGGTHHRCQLSGADRKTMADRTDENRCWTIMSCTQFRDRCFTVLTSLQLLKYPLQCRFTSKHLNWHIKVHCFTFMWAILSVCTTCMYMNVCYRSYTHKQKHMHTVPPCTRLIRDASQPESLLHFSPTESDLSPSSHLRITQNTQSYLWGIASCLFMGKWILHIKNWM